MLNQYQVYRQHGVSPRKLKKLITSGRLVRGSDYELRICETSTGTWKIQVYEKSIGKIIEIAKKLPVFKRVYRTKWEKELEY